MYAVSGKHEKRGNAAARNNTGSKSIPVFEMVFIDKDKRRRAVFFCPMISNGKKIQKVKLSVPI